MKGVLRILKFMDSIWSAPLKIRLRDMQPLSKCDGCGEVAEDGGYFCKKCNESLTDSEKFNILGFWP